MIRQSEGLDVFEIYERLPLLWSERVGADPDAMGF
jgi:hypothetical protein